MLYNLSMFSKPKLLLPEEYLSDAVEKINKAKTRVHLLTMIMMYDDTTADFFDAIMSAAERGVHVEVTGDMFSYMERFGQYRAGMPIRGHLRPLSVLRNRMKRSGVGFTWLGDKASTIITNRTHSKWLVVDEYVYSFGGINLYPDGLASNDYMIRIKDIGIASALIAEQARIVKADRRGHAYRSHKMKHGDDTILIDGGFIGASIIYHEACQLARNATRITYVSQYCPSGRLSKLLKAADTKYYFNHAKQAAFLNVIVIKIGELLSGLKTSYHGRQYLHAKCIIYEFKDGTKTAITGSHNFSNGGVWLGTREVALETSNPSIIKLLEKYIDKHIT